jgi:hypothetical protein
VPCEFGHCGRFVSRAHGALDGVAGEALYPSRGIIYFKVDLLTNNPAGFDALRKFLISRPLGSIAHFICLSKKASTFSGCLPK